MASHPELWRHPKTKALLPIRNEGPDGELRSSPALLKLLKAGAYNLLDGTHYLYNAETKRLVGRGIYLTNKGDLRPRYERDGYTLDPKHPNVIEKRKLVRLADVYAAKGRADAYKAKNHKIPEYFRPATTEQDRISKDIEAKVAAMKENGRLEVRGTPKEMASVLRGMPRSHVSYIAKDDGKLLYRSGGFLLNVHDDYFMLRQPSKAHWSVHYDKAEALYVLPSKLKERVPELVATTEPKTRFPVTIAGVVVRYCKDNYARTRFMSTAKFKALQHAHEKPETA